MRLEEKNGQFDLHSSYKIAVSINFSGFGVVRSYLFC